MKKHILIIIISIVLLILFISIYILLQDKEEKQETKIPDLTYEEFLEEYGEYNYDDIDIDERNYLVYEDEFFSRKYSSKIECDFEIINNDAFLIVKNNSNQPIGTIKTDIVFFNKDNKIISIENVYTYNLEEEGKKISSVYKYAKNYVKVEFVNTVSKPREINELKVSKIKCTLDNNENSLQATISNNNKQSCDRVGGIILFFDEDGNIINSSYVNILEKLKPEEKKTEKLYNYPASYDHYEFIVSYLR